MVGFHAGLIHWKRSHVARMHGCTNPRSRKLLSSPVTPLVWINFFMLKMQMRFFFDIFLLFYLWTLTLLSKVLMDCWHKLYPNFAKCQCQLNSEASDHTQIAWLKHFFWTANIQTSLRQQSSAVFIPPFIPKLSWYVNSPNFWQIIMSAKGYQDGLCDLTLPIKVSNQTHELQMNLNEDSNIRSMNYSLSLKYIQQSLHLILTFQWPSSKRCKAS